MSIFTRFWLDKKIDLILDYVQNEAILDGEPEIILRDLEAVFNDSRDRRPVSEFAFVERCRSLIRAVVILKEFLSGRHLDLALALEGYLLTEITKPRSGEEQPREV